MESTGSSLPACLELASTLFEDTPSTHTFPQSTIYPEALLQLNDTANKYYHNLEATFPSFISASNDSSSILPWKSSRLRKRQNRVISNWSDTSLTQLPNRESSRTSISNASHLFSWSSSDAYIEERRKQLNGVGGISDTMPVSNMGKLIAESPQPSKPSLAVGSQGLDESARKSKPLSQLLSRVVDKEACKFIEERVQATRAKRAEQALRELSERKLKDHELHLNKVRLKEEQDERDIFAATAESKNAGFFGSFFKFGSNSTARETNKFTTSFDDILSSDTHLPESPNVSNPRVSSVNQSATSVASPPMRESDEINMMAEDSDAVSLDSTLDEDGFDDFIQALPETKSVRRNKEHDHPTGNHSGPSTTEHGDKAMDSKNPTSMKKSHKTEPAIEYLSLQTCLENRAYTDNQLHIPAVSKPEYPSDENLLDL